MVRKIFSAIGGALGKLGRSPRGAERSNVAKVESTKRAAGVDDQGRPRTLGHAVYKKVMGRSPKTEQNMSPQKKAEALLKKHGSQTAAAKEAGMHRRSFDRVLKGESPKKANREKIDRAERRSAIKPRAVDRLSKSMTGNNRSVDNSDGSKTFGIWCRIVVSSEPEDRWIYPGGHADNAGALDDLAEIAERDGVDGIHEKMTEIMDTYMPQHEAQIEEIMEIQW